MGLPDVPTKASFNIVSVVFHHKLSISPKNVTFWKDFYI